MQHSENGTLIAALDSVPAVLAIARGGSATAAADTLGVGVATVLRRVERLEEELGVILFRRSPRGMHPTRALERIQPLLEHVEATCRAVQREVARLEHRAEGTVRLATLPGLSSVLLVPRLPLLRERHPDLVLELLPSAAVVHVDGQQADLALRLVRPTSGDLVSRQVVRFELGAFCAPVRVEGLRGRPVADWPFVTWTGPGEPAETRWLHALVEEPRVVFRSPEIGSLLAAARAGVGVVLAPVPLAEAAGLVRLGVPGPVPEGTLHLVAHRALRHTPRVAAVWDWVVELVDADTEGAAPGA